MNGDAHGIIGVSGTSTYARREKEEVGQCPIARISRAKKDKIVESNCEERLGARYTTYYQIPKLLNVRSGVKKSQSKAPRNGDGSLGEIKTVAVKRCLCLLPIGKRESCSLFTRGK